ncbi:ectopic P granules protein 5 homolog [Tetranychus urticae]|uniref:ectopic P granules protein 5 homolog n=1 Tax=Tetranychus urticae TaxID=32264 RepID=UPI00077BE47D|nr:ectopic P granules protein 5 homolog [Tetranychus urticae]
MSELMMMESVESISDIRDQVICKLKRIKPYTEGQLLALHTNTELSNSREYVDKFIKESLALDDCNFYQCLGKLSKWRELLAKNKNDLAQLKSNCEEDQSKAWQLNRRVLTKKGRCSDNRQVEGKHTFKEASLQEKRVKSLESNLLTLRETIVNDHCYHMQMAQASQKHIEYEIELLTKEPDRSLKIQKIKPVLSSLFAFYRNSENDEDGLVSLIKQWISRLVACLLEIAGYEERLFLLNHVLRCPGGISSWAAGFVQCPSPFHGSSYDEAIEILNHCMNMISTIISPIRAREKFIQCPASPTKSCENSSEEYWHLVDADVDEGEDVLVNRVNLTEFDVIHLLKQIPFDSMLKFLTERHSFINESENGIAFGEYSELSMLKLLAISTKMVQILRQGLSTFNCMRFRTLTDYITLAIRKTVNSVSKFWQACKGSFNQDDALVLRLQVEYDHFILRSVVTILSCQRFGVWKFVSVIPFAGVTESMMWHIVWVFYNNGRDEIDELGGLCPYFSDSYWKSKFNEPAMKFLFREKLPSLSSTEAECLLRSLGNMIKSRNNEEIEFVNTIATEMFEISFLVHEVNLKMSATCIQVLSECIVQHPFIISALLAKLKETKPENDLIIDLFVKLPVTSWFPDDSILEILRTWLCDYPTKSLFNRLTRVLLIKLDYGFNGGEPNLKPPVHRNIALIVYDGIIAQTKPLESLDTPIKCTFSGFDFESAIKCAKSNSLASYIEWTWRVFLLFKLHERDYPIEFFKQEENLKAPKEPNSFYPVPNLQIDCEVFPVFKGMENKNVFAYYLGLMMTEKGHSVLTFEDDIEIIIYLLNYKCYIPCIRILECLLPVYKSKLNDLATNAKFVSTFYQLLMLDTSRVVDCLIGVIKKQIEGERDKKELTIFWIKLLCELAHLVFQKYSASWFVASPRGLQQLVNIFDQISSFIFLDDFLMETVIDTFAQHMPDLQNTKQPQQGVSRWIPWTSNNKKCDWTTPFHYFWEKFPDKIWFAFLVAQADSLRMEKIWESIVNELSTNIDMFADFAIKSICDRFYRTPIPIALLPINEWAKTIIDCPPSHPLLPFLWFNFFSNFFANSPTGGSCGLRLVPENLLKRLKTKLDVLIDYHHKTLTEPRKDFAAGMSEKDNHFHTEMVKFYRAAILWLQDYHLHDAFVDVDHLTPQYQVEMLKFVMNSIDTTFKSFVDESKIEDQAAYFVKWLYDLKNINKDVFTENISRDDPNNIDETLSRLKIEKVGPPEEKIPNIMFYDIESIEFLKRTPGAVMKYLRDNIRTIMEEKSYFDNRTQRLYNLSVSLVDAINNLYQNCKKETQLKLPCDKDGYDPDGCSGVAIITIEFMEAVENAETVKNIERIRNDFNNLVTELLELPSDKSICASIFIEKCIPLLMNDMDKTSSADPCESLLRFYLTWIEENSSLNFAPSKNLFNLLIDSLTFDQELQRDNNSHFLLQTSLDKPIIIEYLAPRLAPSRCTINCFLSMYEMIQKNLYKTPPHILFVLLSKFDVSNWLKVASDEKIHQFLNLLINALFAFGQDPDSDKTMLLGLYRKHLQYMVICRFPSYLHPVIQNLLRGMDSFLLYPGLWNDILLSFGFYLPANKTKLIDLVNEMRKYAESQPIFSTYELHNLLSLFTNHFKQIKEEKIRIDLIDYFRAYVQPFSIVLSTISLMWIHSNRKEAVAFDHVWPPLYEAWKPWLISSEISQTVDKKDFDQIWDLFICNLQYLMRIFNESSSLILSYSWRVLAEYYSSIKALNHVVYSEAIQNKLKSLPWNYYIPSSDDIKLMYEACQHEKTPPFMLIRHILCTVNWNSCVQTISYESIPQSMEWLAYSIIYAIDKSDMLELTDLPIFMVTSEQAKSICRLLRSKLKITALIHNKSDMNKFYLRVIRVVCGLTLSEENFRSGALREDHKRKQIIYTETITNFLLDSIRNDPNILKDEPEKISIFLKKCLEDIIGSLNEGSHHREALLTTLLKFINSVTIHDPQHILLRIILELVSESKTNILEMLDCSRRAIKFFPLFIYLSERCITLYAIANGSLDDLIKIYGLPDTFDPDIYRICDQTQAHLTLYVIFQSEKSSKNIIPLLAGMLDWACQLKSLLHYEAKILGLWFMLIKDVCYYASSDEVCNGVISSALKLCRTQSYMVDEVVSQGFLSFVAMKFTKKTLTPKSAFLIAAMSSFLLKRLQEILPSFHPLYNEICSMVKLSLGRLLSIRKNKDFVDVHSLNEKTIEMVEAEKKIDLEGIALLKNWLFANYSDDPVFRFILTDKEITGSANEPDDKSNPKIAT